MNRWRCAKHDVDVTGYCPACERERRLDQAVRNVRKRDPLAFYVAKIVACEPVILMRDGAETAIRKEYRRLTVEPYLMKERRSFWA